ncbi:hypothetical protein EUX98_g7323 [Antrodiella citrinella]|uniref:Uncharacterized protein n=1 Tax=Antrodiella citrinella TaxID=2447956 RepID=A0A4S4MLS6_9APHY|nr:hypothetical protein EUX98_g7323 [Antrodiella citrinella]
MPVGLTNAPVELLVDIFSLACTDAGYTGCALKLVSRAFCDICTQTSLDIQFASVCGRRRMRVFLSLLKRRTIEMRRVKSLFLCEQETRGGRWSEILHVRSDPTEEMLEILCTISPSYLQILSVEFRFHTTDTIRIIPVVPVRFPSLRELSISGPFNVDSFALTHAHALTAAHAPAHQAARRAPVRPRALPHAHLPQPHAPAHHAQRVPARGRRRPPPLRACIHQHTARGRASLDAPAPAAVEPVVYPYQAGKVQYYGYSPSVSAPCHHRVSSPLPLAWDPDKRRPSHCHRTC